MQTSETLATNVADTFRLPLIETDGGGGEKKKTAQLWTERDGLCVLTTGACKHWGREGIQVVKKKTVILRRIRRFRAANHPNCFSQSERHKKLFLANKNPDSGNILTHKHGNKSKNSVKYGQTRQNS